MFSLTTSSANRRLRARLAATALASMIPLAASVQPAQAQVSISITVAPPALPVYEQPPIPDDGYIWTPGYWAWGDDGYYWVPGTWVEPPQVGYLWTPGYWGWSDGFYVWRPGYWGQHVGYYGGINYGWGYGGSGYDGGRWDHDHFSYNRTVNNFGSTHITNVYNRTVIVNNNSRVSYNGGTGGTHARPTAAEAAVSHERHLAMTGEQSHHIEAARQNRGLHAAVNHGRPPVMATSRPGEIAPARPAVGTGGGNHAPVSHGPGAPPNLKPRPGQSSEHGQALPEHRVQHLPAGPQPAPIHHQQAVPQHQMQVHHQAAVPRPPAVQHQPPAYHPAPAMHAPPQAPAHGEEHGPEKKR